MDLCVTIVYVESGVMLAWIVFICALGVCNYMGYVVLHFLTTNVHYRYNFKYLTYYGSYIKRLSYTSTISLSNSNVLSILMFKMWFYNTLFCSVYECYHCKFHLKSVSLFNFTYNNSTSFFVAANSSSDLLAEQKYAHKPKKIITERSK